ncbi:two-component sensor histidine kinase [Streptomyces sp. ISL-12]|uniref:sensor histidine kinase n=1 Tax=Streptomyces sp. ISL-12 TaxID=2819177 RepID=UPI001BE64524|nr:histidine kinase [Streptomyces sp. ISL-12]MBT2414975.1 two-component sensor histidine kinase [Streptomyces sp. ISL-12]
MVRLLRPLVRGTTYTRLLHLWVPMLVVSLWILIDDTRMWAPAVALAPLGLIAGVRGGERLQAQWLLLPGGDDTGFSPGPSVTWADRLRTVVWLEVRMALGWLVTFACVWLPITAHWLIRLASGHEIDTFAGTIGPHWAYALLVPVPLVALYGAVVGLGALVTAAARTLLGPSPAERLATLEERTEQLLERNRIARELHDSIGHALTVAVVQAGAARAAGDPDFTDRALSAIEDTGRTALEDLERVLGVLREERRPVSARPTLADADRLLESARSSGAKLDTEVTGPLETVPGPVSREGYRILQEALTNVLRHAGAVPVRVRIRVEDSTLGLEIRSPLAAAAPGPGRGSGLRGIRERAALLGGHASTGPDAGDWQVHVVLPVR